LSPLFFGLGAPEKSSTSTGFAVSWRAQSSSCALPSGLTGRPGVPTV